MSERYLLVNNLDDQNRRWLQQNIGEKPSDVTILDWNEHQYEWQTKNMSFVISSFPTFVEKDNDLQFMVSNIIDWSDAINQINWQKDSMTYKDNETTMSVIQNKKDLVNLFNIACNFFRSRMKSISCLFWKVLSFRHFQQTKSFFKK